jgi:biopolymer transport protein ExbD
MGGAAPVESGKGKKKSLDSELNLVPFIDLLSCLISFLLITAVWTQVSALRVAQTGGISAEESEPKEGTIDVRVTLTDRGYTLSLAGALVELPKVSRVQKEGEEPAAGGAMAFDTKALLEKLTQVKQNFTEQRAVTVAAEDSVVYDDLIESVDAIYAIGLQEISVTAAVN